MFVWVGIRVDSMKPHILAASRFRDGLVGVPPRHQRHRKNSAPGQLLHFSHRVVVDLGDDEAELRINYRCPLATESEKIRIRYLRRNTRTVHELEPRADLIRSGMHILDTPLEKLKSHRFRAVPP